MTDRTVPVTREVELLVPSFSPHEWVCFWALTALGHVAPKLAGRLAQPFANRLLRRDDVALLVDGQRVMGPPPARIEMAEPYHLFFRGTTGVVRLR